MLIDCHSECVSEEVRDAVRKFSVFIFVIASVVRGMRTRHHAFQGMTRQMPTLYDMSLTSNLLLNSAVTNSGLLAALEATSTV